MKKVAIQGVRGAFHEEAAQKWFGTENIEIVPTLLFEDLVKDVAKASVHYAAIAIENTISGTIHQNLRLLTEHKVQICGEVNLRIKQNLGVLPGTTLKELTEVRSHYMAINQCRKYFGKSPQIKLVEDIDTALSAKTVVEKKLKTVGAIASMKAMHFYGLEVIAESIETNKDNYTRFFIIEPQSKTAAIHFYNKVTLSLVLPHATGSLNQLLSFFSKKNINLSKLESIPILGQPYRYRFIMDLELPEEIVFEPLQKKIKELTESYQILGKYYSTIKSRSTK
jgi:prephenate dehydratase